LAGGDPSRRGVDGPVDVQWPANPSRGRHTLGDVRIPRPCSRCAVARARASSCASWAVEPVYSWRGDFRARRTPRGPSGCSPPQPSRLNRLSPGHRGRLHAWWGCERPARQMPSARGSTLTRAGPLTRRSTTRLGALSEPVIGGPGTRPDQDQAPQRPPEPLAQSDHGKGNYSNTDASN
jgi:hypothetical protein